MEDRVNAGYKIINSIKFDKRRELVIGMHPTAPSRYVVWDCTDGNNYDTGGYTSTYRDAMRILAERITRRAGFLPLEWKE